MSPMPASPSAAGSAYPPSSVPSTVIAAPPIVNDTTAAAAAFHIVLPPPPVADPTALRAESRNASGGLQGAPARGGRRVSSGWTVVPSLSSSERAIIAPTCRSSSGRNFLRPARRRVATPPEFPRGWRGHRLAQALLPRPACRRHGLEGGSGGC